MKTVALAICVGLLAALAPSPAVAQDHLISVATVAPEGSLWMKEMHKLDDKLREKTDGHVGFKFYPGGVAGDDKTMLEKMHGGQFVGAALTGVGLGEIVPAIRVMEIPFTFRSYAETDYVLKKLSKWFKKKFTAKGYKVLGWSDQGFVYIMSKKRIENADDMRASKPWVWDVDPLGQAAFASFGINPIPLSIENVATSLDSGMIDTFYISPVAALALQWWRKAKYVIDFPVVDGFGALVIKKDFFDGLPEKYQVILETLCSKYLRALSLKTRKANDKALKTLKGKGLELIRPKEEHFKQFMDVGVKASDSLAGKLYSRKLLDKVRALLDEYRRK